MSGSIIEPIKTGPPPTNITVIMTQTTATLTWQVVPDASGYYLFRAPGVNASYGPLTAALITAPTFKDPGLAPNTEYWWIVQAIYPDGRTGTSTPVNFTTPAAVNPTGFTATLAPGGDVTLKWDATPGAAFYWLQGDGVPAQKVSATTYTVKSLQSGTHSYALIAYYNNGEGGQDFGDENNPVRTSVAVHQQLHVCGITADGKLWHTLHDAFRPASQAPWDLWEDVMASGAGDPGSPFVSIDCVAVKNPSGVPELHVCGITLDNRLLHTIRFAPGTWQPWGDAGALGLAGFDFRHVGVAGINDELHVCVTARRSDAFSDYRIWHAIRFSNSFSWQLFDDVNETAAGRPDIFLGDVACATVNGLLHVCARGTSGGLWHTIRLPQDWQSFGNVRTIQSNNPGIISSVGIAGIGESLHVCVQANRDLWHTIRIDNASWQTFFGNVRKAVENSCPSTFTNVSCTNVDSDLHICSVTDAGSILHTIRFSTPPAWQSPFVDVTNELVGRGINPGAFQVVSVAGF